MLSIIVAVANNNAIGRKNKLLWHISDDLKYFKSVTMGHPIIMGRKTYESVGRPLPGRRNIVLTKRGGISYPDIKNRETTSFEICNIADNIVYESKHSKEEFFVTGGGDLYRFLFKYADKLYITRVDASVEDADTFFPLIKENEWQLESKTERLFDNENGIYFWFETYKRR